MMPVPLSLPADEDQHRAALAAIAAKSQARRVASSRMACRAGQWIEAGQDWQVYGEACSLVDGDWAYLQLSFVKGGYLIQLEGLPVNLPALMTASLDMAGEKSAQPDLPEAAKLILAKLFGQQVALVTSTELDRFVVLIQNARIANGRRDDRAAENNYRQALLILERAQSKDSPGVGKLLSELALEVSNQGRSEEAAALFRRADPIIQRSPNPPELARYDFYRALDAANDARYADALAFARDASSRWRAMIEAKGPSLESLGDDQRVVWRGELAHSLNIQAAMALRTGDLAEAEASIKEALEIVGENRVVPPWWKPEILVTMGRVQAALGRLNQAETSFRGALVYQQRLFGNTAPTATTLLALSGVYADEGLFDDSLRAYEFGVKILAEDEIARGQITFDQVAPLLVAASAIGERTPARRGEMNAKIFEGLQLLSGGVTDQTIRQASLRLAAKDAVMSGLVHDLQESERLRDTARIALAQETSLPDEQRGAAKERALLEVIAAKTAEHEGLQAKLATDFPAYAKLTSPQPVALSDLQAQLRPGEAMLLFEIGRSKSFTVLISAGQVTARPITLDQAGVASTVRSLRKAFAQKGGRLGDFDLVQAFGLYQSLFAPIEADLAGVDQLILVQGGALASLPAALLVTNEPGSDTDYRHAAWLARKYATFEVPSIRAFADLRGRKAEATAGSQPFFGIGNPSFVGEGGEKNALARIGSVCRDDGPFPAAMLNSLAPLPDTALELRTVATSLGADDSALLLGPAATEQALRQQPLGDARVLYFATHALLPGELTCQSEPALALSPPASPATSRDQDGLFDASEVAGLRLNADLVVLSACNTGQTESKFGGQALSGLAESFFYAGARSLLASHWQVPSAATAKLMVGMFDRLREKNSLGTARALRDAQLALLDHPETAHPFFWAAFTLIGDSAVPGGATADMTGKTVARLGDGS
jgi:CHAT domain-containing protein